jgi:oxygen-independent coproporphyrinogen-3 oxidase
MTRAEVTVECNPGSLSADKIAILGEFAINRVSLGVQSFQPEHRDTLGRAGPLDDLVDMLSALDREGISNIGMDLIYGIPGQELDDWRSDLHQACEHGIWHLSTYELTWEEGTRLAASNAEPVDEDRALEMWHLADDVTAEYGLSRYEVSNLSRAGRECAHNDAIWHGETYLGLGPAASSFDGTVRRSNPEDISAWLEGAPPERDELSPAERAAEILAFGLRTIRGWTPAEFLDATDHDYMLLRGETLDQLADEGLLLLDRRGVRPTQRGLLCADYIGGQLI